MQTTQIIKFIVIMKIASIVRTDTEMISANKHTKHNAIVEQLLPS